MIIGHMINKYQTKGASLQKYHHLNKFSIAHVLREQNDWINFFQNLQLLKKLDNIRPSYMKLS